MSFLQIVEFTKKVWKKHAEQGVRWQDEREQQQHGNYYGGKVCENWDDERNNKKIRSVVYCQSLDYCSNCYKV